MIQVHSNLDIISRSIWTNHNTKSSRDLTLCSMYSYFVHIRYIILTICPYTIVWGGKYETLKEVQKAIIVHTPHPGVLSRWHCYWLIDTYTLLNVFFVKCSFKSTYFKSKPPPSVLRYIFWQFYHTHQWPTSQYSI